MDDEPPLMAGGFPISAPSVHDMKLFMLIWGPSGSGKTTLAATAPGRKLLVLLDPGGDLSLAERDDVSVLNLTGATPLQIMTQLRAADPFTLSKVFAARPDFDTVIIDSMTTLAHVALQDAVTKAGGSSTIEVPGRNGWGIRNQMLIRVTTVIMRMCAEHKKHLILITHEAAPDKNEAGVITGITMSLSAGVANQVGLRFNEIWHLEDLGSERRIAVRTCRNYKPCKTRLFISKEPEFVWHYDADTQVGEGIADWYHAWQAGSGKKLPLPVRASSTPSRGAKK